MVVQPAITNVIDLLGYANTPNNAICLSDSYYSVVSQDNCQSVAVAKQVATGML